ncbi:hypothetical protein COO60DRAFT_1518287 [Scenedesmus sp. NREL 46B-D3]|nr:hypothetical protein COO60DRAFT_1518287 [Scenedesmus sp. NREL 46B-D3]
MHRMRCNKSKCAPMIQFHPNIFIEFSDSLPCQHRQEQHTTLEPGAADTWHWPQAPTEYITLHSADQHAHSITVLLRRRSNMHAASPGHHQHVAAPERACAATIKLHPGMFRTSSSVMPRRHQPQQALAQPLAKCMTSKNVNPPPNSTQIRTVLTSMPAVLPHNNKATCTRQARPPPTRCRAGASMCSYDQTPPWYVPYTFIFHAPPTPAATGAGPAASRAHDKQKRAPATKLQPDTHSADQHANGASS